MGSEMCIRDRLAFMVYMGVLGSVFISMGRIYRKCRYRPDLEWAMNYARMMEATTVGFAIGAFFLNRGHFDLWYHWLALVAALNLCANAALRRPPQLGADQSAGRQQASEVVVSIPGLRSANGGRVVSASADREVASAPAPVVWRNRRRWR